MATVNFIKLTVKSNHHISWLSQARAELGRGHDYQQDLATGTCPWQP